MAPEVRWQASSAAGSGGSETRAPDRESVESLLRKLIKRIEESERRYEEALDELHARLGQVSYSASVNEALGTPEETENSGAATASAERPRAPAGATATEKGGRMASPAGQGPR